MKEKKKKKKKKKKINNWVLYINLNCIYTKKKIYIYIY